MIQTARLALKPRLIDRDIEREVNWLNDPVVVQFSEQRHRKHTIDSQIKYICSFHNTSDRLLYEIRSDGCLIGSISAVIDRNNMVADLGIMIGDTRYWGQGFGSEAWIAFSDHLVSDHGVRKLEAGCMATNLGMIFVATKAGMFLEGEKRSHFLVDGHRLTLLNYGRVA